ncbi:MAG: DUF1080 domain-containing protein [Lewinellaceae bacterium]|nr:DUF1080 domain-containing protein [Lewinellaceae bacterium]
MKKLTLLTLTLLACITATAQDGWTDLFNDNDFRGWKKLNGAADYTIENGVVTGTAKLGTPNTFLATEKSYADFILEVDVHVENLLNSGIQIRSLSTPDYQNGRVHGYQVEIDPGPRAYSGGLYDEARRAWLYPLSMNPKGRKAFKPGDWNTYHIEAIGNQIRVWVNGIQCTNLVDDMTAAGFIALQVHSIGKASEAGTKVRWRNMRIKTENLESDRWTPDPDVPEISYLVNQLTDWEKRKGYRLLWDGKTSAGWRGAKLDGFPNSGWTIHDGILTIQATDGGEATGPGDIITTDQFSDFELELEFMITEGANSGIKYFVDPEINKGTGSAIGCEFQLLDDAKHPDAQMGVAGNRTLASLYDLIPSRMLSNPYSTKAQIFKGIGAWNKARIVSKNGHVEHWLNNEKMVEYERFSQMFEALVNYSKYKVWPGFGRWPQGHILLQDHGNTVHFRSIKIREF